MFDFLYKKYVGSDEINDPEIRSKAANLEGISSVIVNFIIFALKLIAGLLINSISLIADSIHTLSDIVSSIIIVVGFRFAKKPEDKDHPFGHQRIESITGIIVAVLLIITGVEFIISSVKRIIIPQHFKTGIIFIALVVFTIILKEILARLALYLGKRINSPALMADFWHHRIDAISSLFVIVALVFAEFDIYSIDGYMGIIVSFMIIYSGMEIMKNSSVELIGRPPEKEILNKFEEIINKYKDSGVYGFHDTILHYYGRRVVGSFHIEVDKNLSLCKAHTLAEKIEDDIKRYTDAIITIHVDPIIVDDPLINEIRDKLNEIIRDIKEVSSFHDLRTVGEKDWLNILFDLSLQEKVSDGRKIDIKNHILKELKNGLKDIKIHDMGIVFEPLFSY